MLKAYSLKKNVQFQAVYRRGKSTAAPHLVLLHLRRRDIKIGISVSKKVGNAVKRNLVKRRIRECVRPLIPSLAPGHYVIIARSSSATASYAQLDAQLKKLLQRQKLFKEGSPHT